MSDLDLRILVAAGTIVNGIGWPLLAFVVVGFGLEIHDYLKTDQTLRLGIGPLSRNPANPTHQEEPEKRAA